MDTLKFDESDAVHGTVSCNDPFTGWVGTLGWYTRHPDGRVTVSRDAPANTWLPVPPQMITD